LVLLYPGHNATSIRADGEQNTTIAWNAIVRKAPERLEAMATCVGGTAVCA
jgi:hypothetical protein